MHHQSAYLVASCELDASVFDTSGPGVLNYTTGRVPSTAGSSSDQRAQIFGGLRCLPALLPAGWQVELRADHRVAIESHVHIPLPASATDLVAAVTSVLLALTPYLEVLAEAGLSGTANTWPG